MVAAEGAGMIDFLGDVLAFMTDNLWGTTGIANRLWEHIQLSAFATAVASALAIPAGLTLGHLRRGGVIAVSAVNIGRAIPSFAIVALALPISIRLGLGLGFWPTFLALVALALPPMFTNTYTGVSEVDPAIVEAGRGMGLSGRRLLGAVEFPMASPVILAGVRISTVQVVATATLGALVGWGGLGRFIIDGFAQQDNVEVFVGGLLVALLAVAVEIVFEGLERWVIPAGLRRPTSPEESLVAVGA